MKPVPQTRRAPRGDCVRACLASLLELPIAEVPDFTNMREDLDSAYPTEYLERQSFLRERGFVWVEISLKNQRWAKLPFATLAIFKGTHISGEPHAIVGICEDEQFKPLYDPLEPEGLDVQVFRDGKIDSVAFLVPLDPAKMHYSKPYQPQIILPNGPN